MDIKELYELYKAHPCITTDSRDCPEGSIFLALKGASFNGNLFAEQAIEKGCAYAIVDDQEVYERARKRESEGAKSSRLILVKDCLQTYKDLAREHRRQFDIPVIGITGTNGKTTTKELIAAVLSQKYNVLYTQGNFNNDVGVPKTLFRLTKEHEIAVIEMGASHPGDIKTLVETAEPTCGLITNVGRAHLEGFGSFEGVINTKCELYDFLRSRKDSLIFINADNEHLMERIGDDENLWLSPYSTQPENRITCISGEVISCDPFLKFRWREPQMILEQEGRSNKWHKVQTHLIGAYNIDNLLAAIAVGINFGVDRKKICSALEEYVPSNNRSQMTVTEHNHLIVDAYNANPTSMQAALENFKLIQADRKMAILGKMGELGSIWKEEHQKVVDFLKEVHFDEVWLVGDEYYEVDDCPFRRFHNVEEVKEAIRQQQPQGYYILIKGSNSNKLFELPELL
ncbi:MAG: UDP-N-acetylmuramoyl-tripeptide--D-alanyl-D-alanine ligase [Prevotella sp.]|nr:UDP-N-acetylmuramoyl-tripeptide--D-alanyl-D-alanine ligase [Prevotella sp.]MBR7049573.1 UDP-N-acetylmuramoyl-tripeptide--D-alanyl-D-alanine ligase [Prevotella sp.]